jgi:ABC-type transport system involved in multi-copper enzyme maturation permease subunit
MFRKAWMMAKTEIRMVFKNKQVKMIPVFIIAMSVGFSIIFAWIGSISLFAIGPELEEFQMFYSLFMPAMMGIFITALPVMLPVMIAADSIVGEKERRTIVPLLATPLTDAELLFGKMLTAMVPGIIVAYASFGLSVALVNGMLYFLAPTLVWVWPSLLAIIQSLIMPILFSALAVGIMVIISGRVGKVYEAYQWGGSIIMPAMLVAFSLMLEGTGIDWIIFFFVTVILVVAVVGLFRLALNLFNRDQLITRL